MPLAAGLYYGIERGNGPIELPPVVLLHDAGSSRRLWPTALRALPGWQVIALDLPGHGNSTGAGMQSVAAYARSVLDFLVEINYSQAVFAGQGLGAAVALQLAATEPEWTAGVISLAGGAHLNLPPDLVELFQSLHTLPLALLRLSSLLAEPGVSPASPLPPAAAEWLAMMRSLRPSVVMGDWRAAAEFDLCHDTYRITAPLLAAAGMNDRLVPLAPSQFLAGQLPQARLQLVADAGHLLAADQPKAVAAAVLEFLNSIKPDFVHLDQGLPLARVQRDASQAD